MKKNVRNWKRLARYLAGEMGTSEEIAFRREMKNSPGSNQELKLMEKTWKYFDEDPSNRHRNTGRAWERLRSRIERDGLLDTRQEDPLVRRLSPGLRVAAIILLLLGMGLPAFYFGVIRNAEDAMIRQHHSDTGVRTVDLPDGSRVYLNKGAEIRYPRVFRKKRDLELKGEAYFEVMSDPADPFTVRSGNVEVSVLGTSFNVRSADGDGHTEVFVEGGRVRMTREDNGRYIILEPGEVGQCSGSALKKTRQTDPNYISWKTKDFKFVNANLEEVLRELEESYHVEIIAEGISPDQLKITTSYSEQSIDAILETIGTAFGLKVSRRKGSYYLSH